MELRETRNKMKKEWERERRIKKGGVKGRQGE